MGNFVEIKNSTLARGAKANHLAYLGDAMVGERVNYGAGSITANYDGANKHRTVIEDDVHVGSNCVLVAPVTIGRGGTVGGGSTITKDTPPGALAVARGKQVSIANWQRPQEEAASSRRRRAAQAPLAQQRHPRLELGALHREEGLDVAHVGVAGEQPLRQRQVARHVRRVHDQDEVGPGRDPVALLHGAVAHHALASNAACSSCALAVQRDLHHRLQAVAQHGGQPVGAQDGDLPLDQPGVAQALDPPQAGGRRHVHALAPGPGC